LLLQAAAGRPLNIELVGTLHVVTVIVVLVVTDVDEELNKVTVLLLILGVEDGDEELEMVVG